MHPHRHRHRLSLTSDNSYFAAGITDGGLLTGVRYNGDRIRTQSIVVRSKSGTIRFFQGEHQTTKWEACSRR